MGESGESGAGTPDGDVAHRGHLLEADGQTAARGVFNGPFGLVLEMVELQAA